MSSSVIVVVADLDNSAHGEINVVGSSEEAAQLVETLIESGYDQARVRVFAAEEFQIQVYHRPVVALTTAGDAEAGDQPEAADEGEETDQKEEAPLVGAEAASSVLTQEAASEPYSRNGVRFSSQFSPA